MSLLLQPGTGIQGLLADHRVDKDRSWKLLQQQVVASMRAINHPLLSVVPWQDSKFFSPVGKTMNDSTVMERLYRRRPFIQFYNDDGQGNAWGLYRQALAGTERISARTRSRRLVF